MNKRLISNGTAIAFAHDAANLTGPTQGLRDVVVAYKKNTALLSCPFCGIAMHQHKHCFSHPRPAKGDCLLRHYSFSDKDAWNTRAAQVDRNPKGHDGETRLDAKHESAVPQGDAHG